MAYSKTTWVNDTTPAINADNLNNMEDGIEAAHDKKPYLVKDGQASGTQTMNSNNAFTVNLDTEIYSDANYSLSTDIITISAAGTYLIMYQVTINTSANVSTTRDGWAAWVEQEPSGGGGYSTIEQLYSARYERENSHENSANGTGIYVAAAGDKIRLRTAYTSTSNAAHPLQQNKSWLQLLKVE